MNSLTRTGNPPLQSLCDANGQLSSAAIGWSPRPQVHCALPGNVFRRKRWNHWCVTTPRWMLSLTLANVDYLSFGAVYFLDLDSGEAVARRQIRLFGRGCELPDTPLESHAFHHPLLQLKADAQPGRLRLTVIAPDIGGQPLHAALDIQRPAHLDSVNLVVPLANNGFHATSRHLGLPTNGSVHLGQRQYNCDLGQSFAALDFGRGVWPLHSHWTRAAFAAPGGIAGNFGSGWTDASGLSENALWFGGELTHLECQVRIEQTASHPLAPWALATEDRRVDLTFTPRQFHRAGPRLGPFYAGTGQWFGHFNGMLRDSNGERVPVHNAVGWLGNTEARW
ncbi:DUF2804 domain-containing protein [Pseudomonas sp. LS44]|uniref:DUF2804 domain-containing protein n=1 Tax=Pseudomonas sp. LS44 TaxID=1357074 RepID=UPI00215B1572|nr:DUF2804 domain-containing protein [Pseudomonas sp. LS44]UVE19106.1 DUF2804 domain-containing protein [Pseudomonas sp. LS44]